MTAAVERGRPNPPGAPAWPQPRLLGNGLKVPDTHSGGHRGLGKALTLGGGLEVGRHETVDRRLADLYGELSPNVRRWLY